MSDIIKRGWIDSSIHVNVVGKGQNIRYRVIDGMHRITALQQLKKKFPEEPSCNLSFILQIKLWVWRFIEISQEMKRSQLQTVIMCFVLIDIDWLLCVYVYFILISTDFNKSNLIFVKSTLIDRITFLKSGRAIAIDALKKEQTPSKAKRGAKKGATNEDTFQVISFVLCFRTKLLQIRWFNWVFLMDWQPSHLELIWEHWTNWILQISSL